MKILLVGNGGREHSLAFRIVASPLCSKLYCASGNAGIAKIAEIIEIDPCDVDGIIGFCLQNNIDFVISGPEAPLVVGLADKCIENGIKVFGPTASAARLEGSKSFTKDLCIKYSIPTAKYGKFNSIDKATAFIENMNLPIVVKADGLAAGKGVIIAENKIDAINAATEMLSGNSFGNSGEEIIIEEFLDGEECSYFAVSDGENILPLSSAQDHKRAYDNDQGPNTGGMGAYSPARSGLFTPELEQKILDRIIIPTVNAMQNEGCPFSGVLYAGIMVCNNEPYLLEYNARFGDPECQALMLRWDCDVLEILYAVACRNLDEVTTKSKWKNETAICVVMASKGYPSKYTKNTVIKGLDSLEDQESLHIFHAGTAIDNYGNMVNIGGRVLGITAIGDDINSASKIAYDAIDKIEWDDGFYRKDIGWRAKKQG